MATQKREFVPGNYYHIYNRGNSKQKIFNSESDKSRFSHLLYLCNGKKSFYYKRISAKNIFSFSFEKGQPLIEICAWVLMSNHFHLLIYIPENSDSENISKFIGRLESSYLKYFNEKHERSGGLFEGRFKSVLVDDDKYLKHLFSYIHLNPLKMLNNNWKEEGLKIKNAYNYLSDYKFSSFHDLVLKKERFEKKILSDNFKVNQISDKANSIANLFSNM